MNIDDTSRGMNPARRPMQSNKTYGTNANYTSPSANYNYGQNHNHPHPHGNSGYTGQGGYNGQQQQPRRRVDRFKRETLNTSERLLKQNDMIIRLLKEIRDRLPAPPAALAALEGIVEPERCDAPDELILAKQPDVDNSQAEAVDSMETVEASELPEPGNRAE